MSTEQPGQSLPGFFCWHHWTKWSKPVVTKDRSLVQQKYCLKCSKVKVRFE